MNQVPLVQAPSQEREALVRIPTTEALEMPPRTERLSRTASPAQPIPRWKQMIVTLVPAYLGSTLFGLALFPLLPGWPFAAINLVMNLFLVLMLTYVALPLAQHWLAGWLSAPSTFSQRLAASRRRLLRHARLLLAPVSLALRRFATSLPAFQLLVRRYPQKLIARTHLRWAPGRWVSATIQIRVTVHQGGYAWRQ